MSAIFGIISKNGKQLDESVILKMQTSLMHRATDGKGQWHAADAFLGHHKLVISPEQNYEQLPYEDGNYIITADARIDNRNGLFNYLEIAGGQQERYTDACLILDAYRKWGDNCVDYIEGDFAFCIWNKETKKLFCAVDHIGQKPLFYYDGPDAFIFSSELKGIEVVKNTPDVFNEQVLIEYFFSKSDHSKTYNDEIFALCGGHKLVVAHGKVSIEKYWQPRQTGKYRFSKDEEWADCLRELLYGAVENRMRTDLPVGITLSGGLDSSAIACIAGRLLEKRNKPLYAFSSVLPETHTGIEQDERRYIGIVGKHLKNLEQTYVEAPGSGPFRNLERTFELEETLPNAFFYMDQAISAAAKAKHIRVLFSGFGGDYFVSWKGNSVIYQLVKSLHFAEAFILLQQAQRYEKKSLGYLLKTDVVAFTNLYNFIRPILHKQKLDWQQHTTLNSSFLKDYSSTLTFRNPASQVDFMTNIIGSGQVGRLAGIFSNRDAAFGMSTAMPMFDRHIMEFMLDVPVRQFRVGGFRRSIMRRAMGGILPPEIQWRSDKMPYSPDYISRITGDKQFIETLLNSKEYDFAWKYIDKKIIVDQLDKIKPVSGMTRSSDISGIRIVQGVISVVFLQWLKCKGYIIK